MLKGLAVIGIRLVALNVLVIGIQAFMGIAYWLSEDLSSSYYVYAALNFLLTILLWAIAPSLASLLTSGVQDIDIRTGDLTARTIILSGSFLIGLYLTIKGVVALTVLLPGVIVALSDMMGDHSATFSDSYQATGWNFTLLPRVAELMIGMLMMGWYYRASKKLPAE